MPGLFVENNVIERGVTGEVTDTTSETLSVVSDMQGFDEITYIVKLGDVDAAAVLTFQPKENTASSTSSPTPTAISLASAAVAGDETAVVTTGGAVLTEDGAGSLDDKIIVINVKKNAMSKRYVFLSITATVESYEVDSITVIKGCARNVPVTQGSNVVSVVSYAA